MAQALITNREYTNLFRAETTPFLMGNVGDVIQMDLDFQVAIESVSSYGTSFNVEFNNITRNAGSWLEDGFIVGSTIVITTSTKTGGVTTNYTKTTFIETLTPTLMIVNDIGTIIFSNYPFNDGTVEFKPMSIVSIEPIKAMEFSYSLIPNSQITGGAVVSLVDGTTPTFKNTNIDSFDLIPIDLIPFGYKSGASFLSATIRGRNILILPLSASNPDQKFTITLKYLLTPTYEAIGDLQNETLPSYFDDNDCLTDAFTIKMLPQAGNPNVSVSTDSTDVALLGNTGWFNENYNGGVNTFSVVSYETKDDIGIPVSGIQTSGDTQFTIVLNDANASASSRYKFGFQWSPENTGLISKNSSYYQNNVLYNGLSDTTYLTSASSSAIFTGYANSLGAQMDVLFSSLTISGTLVTIKGTFKPNADFQTFTDGLSIEDLNYIIWVSAANPSLATNFSDRVSVLVDFGALVAPAIDYVDFGVTNTFLNHPQPNDMVGVNVLDACLEDEITARSIIKLDTALNETIEEITFTIEGLNYVTLQRFELESTSYDTTQYLKDNNNVQQLAINDTRGFLMANGVERNAVIVERSPIDDSGTVKGYRANYAFRARWEDWIQNNQVPSVFFDALEQNNNFNNDWSSKDNLANWKLTYNVYLKVNRNGTIINARNSFDLTVKDYEESTVWDGAITLWDETKTNSLYLGLDANNVRQNAILDKENTLIEADFDLEDLMGDVGNATDYYGVIRIEEYRNGGIYKINMLSSVLDNVGTQNLLLPLTGETKTKITKVSATKIRLECLIRYKKLNFQNSTYKVSARLGCYDVNLGKYNSKYTLKYD